MKGTRFGNLVIIEQTNFYYERQLVWKLECDCGNHAYLTAPALLRGESHCGCKVYMKDIFAMILNDYFESKGIKH